MLRESLKISWHSFKHRKMRSILTVLGIAIGVAAIVGLVSLGEGMNSAITEAFKQFGTDKIMIMGGSNIMSAGYGQALTPEDLEDIKSVRGVKEGVGILFKVLPVTYHDETKSTYVIGLPSKEGETFFVETGLFVLKSGRIFSQNEKYKVVVGSRVEEDYFEKRISIGSNMEIKGIDFDVIGILESTGDPQDDRSVFIPLDAMHQIFGDGPDELTMVYVQVNDEKRVAEVAKRIEDELDDKYGKDSFTAITSEQLASQIGNIFSIISLVLAGIASISLLVAGIGIANTMFMSVMERTREIGIMKAIGATNPRIMFMFITESAIIGFVGGVIGCLLGYGVSYSVSIISKAYLPIELGTKVTPELLGLGLGFAVVVGVISGLIPARRAAKLQPVEALRYE